MRIVVQRSKEAYVQVEDEIVGRITKGLVLLIGITHDDTIRDAEFLADKVANLRIFEDEAGKMNQSVLEIKGEILSISQFTLYGDCRKGRRPNFMAAARPESAKVMYDAFNNLLIERGLTVETGSFGKMMDVVFTNWGPVTIIIDSPQI